MSRRRQLGAAVTTLFLTAGCLLGSTTEAAALACGDVITEDTTLEHDLLDCPGDGLVIGADHVTLRLNGFMIDGTRTPAPQRLASTRSNRELVDDMRALQQQSDAFGVRSEDNDHINVIGPGVIREFNFGVGTSFSTRGRISNLTLLDNGIALGEGSFRLLIDNNIVISNIIDSNTIIVNGISAGRPRSDGERTAQIAIIRNHVSNISLLEALAQVVANSVVGGGIFIYRDDGSVINNNNVFGPTYRISDAAINVDGFSGIVVSNNKTDGSIRLAGDGIDIGSLLTTSPQASGCLTPAAGWPRVNEGRTHRLEGRPCPTSC